MSTTVESALEDAADLEALTVPGGPASVLERWASVVTALGDLPAVSSHGSTRTFAEVDAVSDQVAAEFGGRRTADSEPVAMFLTHGADAVVGLLALMKLGRVAVTLDPHLPLERLRQIVQLAGSTCCLVDAGHAAAAADLGLPVAGLVRFDDLVQEATRRGTAARPSVPRPPAPGLDDPLCLVFTSGSTGRPKGVVYTHGQALNDAFGGGLRYRLTLDDRVAQVLPLSFAAGAGLLMMALLNGVGVWLYDPRDRGVRGLVQWIADERLSTFHCTPHLLRSLVATLGPDDVLSTVRMVSTVGEAVYGRDYDALRPHLRPGASFVNWSGSSEIGALSFHEIHDGDPVPAGVLPAGRPVPNRQALVMRDDGTVAPPGEAGELVVVSDYLSGGYWRDPESDAAKFDVDVDGRRLCRQGDLARFDDGVLHLLGRQDAAVKIRGYLVDPSEVEAAILDSAAVAEALVVTVTEPPEPTRLVAYVAPDPRARTESVGALRRRLRARLPEYMVPSTIVQVPALPRNERGKVDRPQLPRAVETRSTAAPSTQWEVVLADLWGQVLGLEEIGLDDDFMSLGGDSLSVEEMLVEVAERFGVALVTSDLVEAPTLREFTRRVTLGSAALPSHPDVVALRSDGSGTPLFCFAGGGALTLSFLPMSRHLDDRPVYAFQSHGLERRALPDRTVESAARRALELMRVLQPRGPYLLLGHSFGGLVALEIARRLNEAGEDVELVGLLDTYLPHSGKLVPPGMKTVDRTPAQGLLRWLGPTVEAQVHRVLTKGMPGLDRWKHRARIRLAGVVQFSGQHQFDAFFDHARRVGSRYQLRPYAGRALVVLADDHPDGPETWARYLTGPTHVVHLSAEHSSLMREPHATRIAALLDTELAKVVR